MKYTSENLFKLLSNDDFPSRERISHGLKRTLPKSAYPASTPQLAKKLKFRMVNTFISRVKPMIDAGYTQHKKKLRPVYAAAEQILKDAIVGEYPDFMIDYSKVMVSDGMLTPLYDCKIFRKAPNLGSISWGINNWDNGRDKPSDHVRMLIYSEDYEGYVTLESTWKRCDLSITFKIGDHLMGQTLHVWVFLVSEDGKQSSRSIYLGVL